MRAVLAALAISLLSVPARASDFSQIGEPAFARALLVRPERHQEAFCVSIADFRSRGDGTFSASDVEQMSAALTARLSDEIGDTESARDLVMSRLGWFDAAEQDTSDIKKQKSEIAAEIGGRCDPLFDAFRSGGVAAFTDTLTPSEGLIPLLSLPKCIALTEYVSARDQHPMFGKSDLAELHTLAREGRSDAEVARLDAEIASERAALAAAKPDLEQLGARPMACLATFRIRAEEAGRTSF